MLAGPVDPEASTHTHHPGKEAPAGSNASRITVPRGADRETVRRRAASTHDKASRRRAGSRAGLVTLALLGLVVVAFGWLGPTRGAVPPKPAVASVVTVTVDVDRREVDAAWVRIGDVELAVGAGVRLRIPGGSYRVQWRTASHADWQDAGSYRLMSGRYRLAITPGGADVRRDR
jgi:hypothetical protein